MAGGDVPPIKLEAILVDKVTKGLQKMRPALTAVAQTTQSAGKQMGAGMEHARLVGVPAMVQMTTGIQRYGKVTSYEIEKQNKNLKRITKTTQKWSKFSQKTFGKVGKSFLKFGKIMKKVSWMIVWSFLSLLGLMWEFRGIAESIKAPMQKVVGFFENWGESIERIVTNLALMEMSGIDTTGLLDDLGLGIEGIVADGIKMQGTMAGITMAQDAFAAEAGRAMLPALQDVSNSLIDLAGDETAREWMEELAASFGTALASQVSTFTTDADTLVTALDTVGNAVDRGYTSVRDYLASFMDLGSNLPFVGGKLEATGTLVDALFPKLQRTSGEANKLGEAMGNIYVSGELMAPSIQFLMLPLGVIQITFLAIGVLANIIGATFLVLSGIFTVLATVFAHGGVAAGVVAAKMGLIALGTAGLVFAIVGLIAYLYITNKSFRTIVNEGARLLWASIKFGAEVFEFLFWTMNPIRPIMEGILEIFKKLLDYIAKNIGGVVDKIIGFQNSIRDLKDSFTGLYDKLLGRSIIPELMAGMSDLAKMSDISIGAVAADVEGVGGGGGAGGGPTDITIYNEFNIGSISSDVDVNEMMDMIDERLARTARGLP